MSFPLSPTEAPLRVALVNDYEIVLRGLALMFRPYRERVVLVELDARMPVSQPVDIALFDTHGRAPAHRNPTDDVLAGGNIGKLVVYGWGRGREVENVGEHAAGFVSKGLGADELVQALERVHRSPTPLTIVGSSRSLPRTTQNWPGRHEGLTQREGEVVSLITQGLTNQAIAELTYLSINSVKSYIRTAYRKMAVSSRSQAVLWGVAHGFEPDRIRISGTASSASVANVQRLRPVSPRARPPYDQRRESS